MLEGMKSEVFRLQGAGGVAWHGVVKKVQPWFVAVDKLWLVSW